MKMLAIVLVLVYLYPSCASADRLSDKELVDNVLAIYDPDAGEVPYSGTALVKEVERRWNNLDKESRKKLVAFLDEPVTEGPGAPDGQKMLETPHFKIYYMEQGADAVAGGDEDGNGTADYAESVGRYLEKAWTKEVDELGFAPPPSSEKKIAVHLKKINHNGLTHAATGAKAWIELNSDIVGYTRGILGDKADSIVSDPDGLQAGMLKPCCAHEFFHCIQAAYDWDEANWWCEGSAEWMGDTVFPESKFYCNNVRPRFEKPEVSLFSKKGWFEYASSIWAFYIAENFGGPEVIKRIWEGCKGDTTVVQATESVLGDIRTQFLYYSCYNYLKAYADGARYPDMSVQPLTVPGTGESTNPPESFGANYFSVDTRGISSVTVSFTVSSGQGSARLITISHGQWKILPTVLDKQTGTVKVDIAEGMDTLVVVVAGFQAEGTLGYAVNVR